MSARRICEEDIYSFSRKSKKLTALGQHSAAFFQTRFRECAVQGIHAAGLLISITKSYSLETIVNTTHCRPVIIALAATVSYIQVMFSQKLHQSIKHFLCFVALVATELNKSCA